MFKLPNGVVGIIVKSGGTEECITYVRKPDPSDMDRNVRAVSVYSLDDKTRLPRVSIQTPHLKGCVRATEVDGLRADGLDVLGMPVVAFVVPAKTAQQELPTAQPETIPAPAEAPAAPKGRK